ncbi:MAG: TfoX/Sxy family protein [Geminicoccaceae bacterium]
MAAMNHRVESEFVHFVVESLQPLGPVLAKRMFGGHGIFLHGLMFALVAWDTLYFKVDDGNRAAYEARALEPFAYTGQQGRPMKMSYYEAPSEGLDDPEVLSSWGRDAYAAAIRTSQAKTPRNKTLENKSQKKRDRHKAAG